ncbi:sensor histidine kinase [uncultured Sphingomonas sp.]|uniref:sensor histidine kinase n=1 Tax=uncultured Sphingomonas sp. TaxID=158754 RepID=UPI0025E9FBC6|nr:sensor histidine kinase [uncultured Sphingomonas sp.]
MEFFTPIHPERSASLGLALVVSSIMPLLLLDDQLVVRAASDSFCNVYGLSRESVIGTSFLALGNGEWNKPQLQSLLEATARGFAAIDAYEFELKRIGMPDRVLVLNAHALDYANHDAIRLVLAVSDITAMRDAQTMVRTQADRNDALVREKQVMLQELNHRVANSLQIIASILMQRVSRMQSEEARTHLQDAHHRVMSVASLQRLLASSAKVDVALRPYLTDLCASIGASMIADPGRLTFNVDVDDSVMSPDRSVSVGLIVTELAINALKHAFPDGTQQKCRIDVVFAAEPSGWTLTVSDNGCGLPAEDAQTRPGLGTGIVKALADQLAATVQVSDNVPGTRVTMVHVAAGDQA